MYRATVIGLVLFVAGIAFVLLGWSAPTEFCTVAQGETECTTNMPGIAQLTFFIPTGLLLMAIGWGEIPPRHPLLQKIINRIVE